MSTDFLERLYWALTDEEQHQKTGLDLGELYERTPAVKRADCAFKERLADFQQQDASKAEKLDNCHVASCWAYEQQGFINGFRLGMKLAEELRDKA